MVEEGGWVPLAGEEGLMVYRTENMRARSVAFAQAWLARLLLLRAGVVQVWGKGAWRWRSAGGGKGARREEAEEEALVLLAQVLRGVAAGSCCGECGATGHVLPARMRRVVWSACRD